MTRLVPHAIREFVDQLERLASSFFAPTIPFATVTVNAAQRCMFGNVNDSVEPLTLELTIEPLTFTALPALLAVIGWSNCTETVTPGCVPLEPNDELTTFGAPDVVNLMVCGAASTLPSIAVADDRVRANSTCRGNSFFEVTMIADPSIFVVVSTESVDESCLYVNEASADDNSLLVRIVNVRGVS